MDIEGAENDLLENLIARGTHRAIDTIYVEFHSEFLREEQRESERARELDIVKTLRENGVKVRIWH